MARPLDVCGRDNAIRGFTNDGRILFIVIGENQCYYNPVIGTR